MKIRTSLILILTTYATYAQLECPTILYSGNATYFTNSNFLGACGLPQNENLAYTAALSISKYDSAQFCGTCLQVTGPKSTQIVSVIDESTGLNSNDIDLNIAAFEAIIGSISTNYSGQIKWKLSACPYTSDPLELTLGVGTSPYYFNFLIHRAVNKIDSVEVNINGFWKPLQRQTYNGWLPKGFSPNNIEFTDVKVTDIFGQKIIIPNVNTNNNSISYFASTNFTPCYEITNSLTKIIKKEIIVSYENNFINLIHTTLLKEVILIDISGKEINLAVDLISDSYKTKINKEELSKGYYLLKSIDINNTIYINKIVIG